jgi:hypothetical protein
LPSKHEFKLQYLKKKKKTGLAFFIYSKIWTQK